MVARSGGSIRGCETHRDVCVRSTNAARHAIEPHKNAILLVRLAWTLRGSVVSEALSLALACVTRRIRAVVSGDQQVAPFFFLFCGFPALEPSPRAR